MSHSMAHHHKKDRLDDAPATAIAAVLVDVENAAAADDDRDDEAVERAPPAPSSPSDIAFADVQKIVREVGGSSVGSTSTRGHHQKASQQQNYVAPTTSSPTTEPTTPRPTPRQQQREDDDDAAADATSLFRDIDWGASATYVSGGASHQKHSQERDYVEPTTSPPAEAPTPAPTRPVFSLRDVHSSSGGNADGDHPGAAVHKKHSEEQDGVNPDELPEVWEPPPPDDEQRPMATAGPPTPGPTIDLRRVAPAPVRGEEGADDDGGSCDSKDGAYGRNTRNGGVVLRYQYELVREPAADGVIGGVGGKEDAALHLANDILPSLEEKITDALIPVFFEECLDSHGLEEGGGRRRMLSEGDGSREGHSMLRNMLANKVVGIEAEPRDFPLSQADCNYDTIPQASRCHRIEGALTLHLPPNHSISTLLSSVALATLRAIEGGMRDGSLKLAHEDIHKLHFLDTSYALTPTVLEDFGKDEGADSLGEEPDGVKRAGLIVGILIPLLIVCCCCFAGLMLWRRRRYTPSEDDVGTSEEDDMLRTKGLEAEELSRNPRSSMANSWNGGRDGGFDGRGGEDEDTASDDYESYDEETAWDGSSAAGSARNRTAVASYDDGDEGSEGYSEHSVEEEKCQEDEEWQWQDDYPSSQSVDRSEATEDHADLADIHTNSVCNDNHDHDNALSRISTGSSALAAMGAASTLVAASHSPQQTINGSARATLAASAPARSECSKHSKQEEDLDDDDSHDDDVSSAEDRGSVNPLDPIFENQRRDREKKRKAKKRRKRIRRRYERMNMDGSADGDL